MIMAVVPIPNAAYFVDSRKRPLEEATDFIEIKRERSEMEGKLLILIVFNSYFVYF